MIDVRQCIKAIMTQRGMTGTSLSESMGKNKYYVNTTLNRKGAIQLDTLEDIAKALNCTLCVSLIDNETGDEYKARGET